MTEQELLKSIHNSLCVRFGTTAPFTIGTVRAEKVGFAGIPCVAVTCISHSLDAIVPIVRQRIYAELAERGWGPDDVEFRPTVGTERRRRKFVDENESSASYLQNKIGGVYQFHFEMKPELARATFVGGGSFKPLPTKEAS